MILSRRNYGFFDQVEAVFPGVSNRLFRVVSLGGDIGGRISVVEGVSAVETLFVYSPFINTLL